MGAPLATISTRISSSFTSGSVDTSSSFQSSWTLGPWETMARALMLSAMLGLL